MCGLVGYFSPRFKERDFNAFIDLTLVSQTRGLDSTGIIRFEISNNGKRLARFMDKSTETAGQFLYSRKKTLFEATNPAGFDVYGYLAHVRAATKGSVSVKNAHPFENSKYVGMHNGTVHGYFDNVNKFDTDSEAIYATLEEKGIEEGLRTVNRATRPAYALMFLDKETNTINFIRNTERTLFMGIDKKADTYVVASEKIFLKFVEEKYDLTFDRLFLMNPDVLYSLQKHRGVGFNYNEKLLDVKPKYTPPVGVGQRYHGGGYMGRGRFMGDDEYYGGMEHYNTGPRPYKWSPPVGSSGESKPVFPEQEKLKKQATDFLNKRRLLRNRMNETANNADACPVNIVDRIVHKIEEDELKGVANADIPFDDGTEVEDEDQTKTRPPYSGLTYFDWNKKVIGGCEYCSTVPHYSRRDTITWLDKDHFVCNTHEGLVMGLNFH